MSHDLDSEAEGFERAITRLVLLEHRLFAAQLERFALTPVQYHALVYMARQGQPCTMGCLAEHLRQSSATSTGIVDRLVRRGLAERRADTLDRRRVIVRVTDSGHRLVAEAGADRRQRTVGILATMDGSDRARLVALLDAYLARVAAVLDEGGR